MNFSKSKYCGLWQCPKIAWLTKYKPELCNVDETLLARMETGEQVGELAKGLFGTYIDVTTCDAEGNLDLQSMQEKTAKCLQDGVENICEASFSHNGLYCAVDILHKENDGYAIYEVKSSTHESDVYFADIAYQRYVLNQCGLPIAKTYLININSEYVRQGDLDIHSFFKITDVTKEVDEESINTDIYIKGAESMLSHEEEPQVDLSEDCVDPYPCAFWKYCTRHLPTPSVFDLYRLPFTKKIEYYRKGLVSYEQLVYTDAVKNETRLRQVSFAINDCPPHIDQKGIKKFLDTLTYPLYFLDFETMQPAIPLFDGTSPYQQIPFQYSLHYIEKEGGELQHKEFLAESGKDPRRAIAEQLVADIPANVCVLAYNKSFECSRIKELAETFEDLSSHLLAIRDNIKDLLDPFRAGYYYNKAMGGSFSIKSVLPALFPNDPSLDYHNLEGVHNGGEAMTVFPRIAQMPKEEAIIARKNLLKYCCLDTYAMVKVWQELVRVTQ